MCLDNIYQDGIDLQRFLFLLQTQKILVCTSYTPKMLPEQELTDAQRGNAKQTA